MNIVIALLTVIAFVLIVIAHFAYRIEQKEPVKIVQEIKTEKPKKAKKVNKKVEEKIDDFDKPEPKPKKEKIPTLYGEEWRDLVTPVGGGAKLIPLPIYKISSMGNVWDEREHKMLPQTIVGDEPTVTLNCGSGKFTVRKVKTLVAGAFLGAQSLANFTVVHCDENPKNCAKTNLRWVKIEKGGKKTWQTM